jgi:hypothetical protein
LRWLTGEDFCEQFFELPRSLRPIRTRDRVRTCPDNAIATRGLLGDRCGGSRVKNVRRRPEMPAPTLLFTRSGLEMVGATGIEPVTPTMSKKRTG